MGHFIYYVRSGPNEELRYSLRSLAVNGPGDVRVSIVGDPPSWVDRSVVEVLPGNPYTDPYKNSYHNLVVACEHEPGDFFTMNDDFMILQPMPDPYPVWFWRSISDHMRLAMRSTDPRVIRRRRLFQETYNYLRDLGIDNPNHYELHTPMLLNGTEMLRILDEAQPRISVDNPPIWRTLYANLSTRPSGPHIQRDDVKHHGMFSVPENPDFLSTDEKTFHRVERLVSSVFTEKSPWEV